MHNLSETDKQKKSHGNAAMRHEPAAEQTPAKAACISHRIRCKHSNMLAVLYVVMHI